jgi:K+-transporting ATPase ATPase A chain
MNANPWFQVALFLAILFALSWPLSRWIDGVLDGRLAARWRWMNATERGLLRLVGSDANEDIPSWRYAGAVVVVNLVGLNAV